MDDYCLQLLELAVSAVSHGRWPDISVAAISEPPSAYHHLFKSVKGISDSVNCIDCWTNPYGWPTQTISEKKQQQSRQASVAGTSPGSLPLFQSPPKGLDELSRHILAQSNRGLLFIDSLSPLVDVFGLPSVCSFLTNLRNNAISILFLLHSDLHSQHEVSTLCYGATCLGEVVPANERPEHCIQPHGRLVLKFRRKNGAVNTDGLDYRINNKTGLEFLASVSATSSVSASSFPAAKAPTPVTGAAASLATASATPAATSASSMMSGLGQQLAGGMRLDVSAEEAAARGQVQLPYEHQGQGQLYASGGDFRDYLPEAAGGRRQGNGRLGHILYVRDSDSEDPDSDEDPDDDLDV